MISWIQRTFQQHFKWLFIILLGVVIVSFVFITNTSGGMREGGPKIPDRPFFDLNLSLAADQKRLSEDTRLSIVLQRGSIEGLASDQVEEYARQRYAAIHLSERLGLPEPTPEEIAAHVQTLRAFTDTDGKFSARKYKDFLDEIDANPALTQADVARVLVGDLRFAAYRKLLAGPGYALPADIALELARADTRWTLAVATIDSSSFAPRIEITDTALAAWFEANSRRYEIAPRVLVSAVEFPSAPFAAALTLTEAEIRAAYDANPARFPAEGQIAGDAAFAAVRAQVEAALRAERASRAALTAASDLVYELINKKITLEGLPAFLAAANLTLVDAGPIGRDIAPASLGGNSAVSRLAPVALKLDATRPYSDPVTTPTGAALLVWRESIPAQTPAFEQVRTAVTADYRAAEQRRLFNEAGRQLQRAAKASLASGKSFEAAITATALTLGLKAEVKTLAPFTLATPPEDFDYSIYPALETLPAGGVSEFVTTRANAGLIVHAVEKNTPPADPASPAYAEIRTRLGNYLGNTTAGALLSATVDAELAKSKPAAP